MEETLRIMIENLVDTKDEIEITSEEHGNNGSYKVKAVGNKEQKKVEVEFLD